MLNSPSPVIRAHVLELIDLAGAGQYRNELLEERHRSAVKAHSQKANFAKLHNLFRDVALTAEWLDLGGVDDEPFMSIKRQCRADPKPPRLPSRNVILRFGLPREEDLVLLVHANDGEPGLTSALALQFELAIGHAVTMGVIELQPHPGKLDILYCPSTRDAFASAVTLYDALYFLDHVGWS
jgi:hypothetical protein